MESFFTQILLALSSLFTTNTTTDLQFITPLADDCGVHKISQEFSASHDGIDYISSSDSSCTIIAAADGKVIKSGFGVDGQGYYVAIDHGNGIISEYHHGDGNLYVLEGEAVSAGDALMKMGATGYATATYLHFEVIKKGVSVNPGSLL